MPVYAKTEKPINLGFRSQHTSVKFADIKERVMHNMMGGYADGTIKKKDALSAITHLNKGVSEHKDTYDRALNWQDTSKHLHNALKAAKYDSIQSKEGDVESKGNAPEHTTYGILHQHNIKSALGNSGNFSHKTTNIGESYVSNNVRP